MASLIISHTGVSNVTKSNNLQVKGKTQHHIYVLLSDLHQMLYVTYPCIALLIWYVESGCGIIYMQRLRGAQLFLSKACNCR